MGWLQKQKGYIYLGWRAVIAHPLRKLFSRDDRPGIQRFLDNYGVEGLVPLSVEDRKLLWGAARCIHCGLCDAFDPNLSRLPRTVYDGASLIPVALTRATPDIPAARAAIEGMSESLLAQAEAVCPTRVPLAKLAVFLKQKLRDLPQPATPHA